MISKTRSFRVPHHPIGVLILLAAFAAAAGCSTSASNGPSGSVNHITVQGTSVSGWLSASGPSNHSRAATNSFVALGNAGGCTECHGADLLGGISRVSCMDNPSACHHGTAAGWVAAGGAPQEHGASAKRGQGNSGMYACRICHGNDFTGTVGAPSCLNNAACHGAGVVSPHPSRWRSSSGGAYNHDSTDTSNAANCYRCHAYSGTVNPNNPTVPASPAASGTAPGCFNGTMCHNNVAAPHALGSVWSDPAVGGSAFHGTTAKADLTYCQTCHGTSPRSFGGGTGATTSCSASSCHPSAEAHPTSWWDVVPISTATITHRTAGNRTAACGICHNVIDNTTQGANPSAPSCFSARFQTQGCHAGGPGQPNHAVPFTTTTHTQATTASFTSDCGSCHAVTGTSPVSGAPLCTSCHISDPRGVTGCTSCHANPPDGAVTAYPNVGGAHSVHISLNGAGTPVSCSTCHNGLGSGTLSHYNRTRPTRISPASVAVVSTYNAKGVTAAFDNSSLLRCTNVSCHGGQATPSWRTGTVDVINACLSCHASGTAQYNSYHSGEHSKHLSQFGSSAATCKRCHDATKVNVTGHLTNLETATVFEQTARATLLTALGYNGTSCNPSAGGLSGCHSSENW